MASIATAASTRICLQDLVRNLALVESNFNEAKDGLNETWIECKDTQTTKRANQLKLVNEISDLLDGEEFTKTRMEINIVNDMIAIFKKLLNEISIDFAKCVNDDFIPSMAKPQKYGRYSNGHVIDCSSNKMTYNLVLNRDIIYCITVIAANENNIYKSWLLKSGIIEMILKTLKTPIFVVTNNNNNNNNINNSNNNTNSNENESKNNINNGSDSKPLVVVNGYSFNCAVNILYTISFISLESPIYRDTILKYNVISEYLIDLFNKCVNAMELSNDNVNSDANDLIRHISRVISSLFDFKHPRDSPPPPIEYICQGIDILCMYREMSDNDNNDEGAGWICRIIWNIFSRYLSIADKIFEKLLQCNLLEWLINRVIKQNMKNYDKFVNIIHMAMMVIVNISCILNESRMKILIKYGLLEVLVPLCVLANNNLIDINIVIMRACILTMSNMFSIPGTRDAITDANIEDSVGSILLESLSRGIMLFRNQVHRRSVTHALTEINSNENKCKEYNEYNKKEPIKTISILKIELNRLVTGYVRPNIEDICGMACWPNDIASIIIKYCDDSDGCQRFTQVRSSSALAVLNATKFGIIGKIFANANLVTFKLYALLMKPNLDMNKNNNRESFCEQVGYVIEIFDQIWNNGLLTKKMLWQMIEFNDNNFKKMKCIIQDTSLPNETRQKVENFMNKIVAAVTAKQV